MKKKLALIYSLLLAVSISLIPVSAAEAIEGRPTSPRAYDGTEFVEAYDMPAQRRVSEKKLGSYTIKQYLNNGYMKFTDESFGKSAFPEDGVFKFVTDLRTDGTKTEIKVGIAYVDFWGTDTFFASTKMGLSDEKLFTVTKTPGKNTKYYGCIDNNTGGKVYGSFSIYAVTA